MWQAFKDDIEGEEFKNREDFKGFVRAWADSTIEEIGRVEEYYLNIEDPTEELDIKIGEDNGQERRA